MSDSHSGDAGFKSRRGHHVRRSRLHSVLRGLRKRRENCISAGSFFLLLIGSASLGSDRGWNLNRAGVTVSTVGFEPIGRGSNPLPGANIRRCTQVAKGAVLKTVRQ